MTIAKKSKLVGIIGKGRWGKKVIKILKHNASIKYIIGKNYSYSL